METLTYTRAALAADEINQYCGDKEVNAIATAAPGFSEKPGQATYIFHTNRAIPPDADGTIVCRLKALQNQRDARCVLFSGGDCPAPQHYTQGQVETFIK